MKKLQDIIETLNVVAFEPNSENQFSILTNLPDWFVTVYSSAMGVNKGNSESNFDLLSAFPFVENFMFDANIIWSDTADGTVKSGIWIEESQQTETMMEAIAVKKGSQCYLLIENMTGSFSHRQSIYQKAREMALLNEKLVVELNHQQRSLQKQIESHLKHEASLSEISASVGSTNSAVMICKPDGSIDVYNKALVDIYQLDEETNYSRHSLLDNWIKEAEQTYPEIKRVVNSGKHWEGEFETRDLEGQRKWIRLAIGPVINKDSNITHFVCVANDLSEYLSTKTSKSNDLKEYDFTTHLPNRRYFWREIHTSYRKNEACSLLYIDLDYFKSINERIGHEAGDQLLSAMASRISRSVKRTDFVAHLGGDEFVVILKGQNSKENVITICDRLLKNIREPLALSGSVISVSACIGHAAREQGETASDLLKNADTAMYAAKELGRNHARSYSRDLDKRLDAFHHQEYEIRSSIAKQQFELYYQPQVSMLKDPYFRLEALVRWNHPELGLLAPSDFIPVAESSGLIVPLGEWILKAACSQGNLLLGKNVPVKIAVNISVKQLKHPDFLNLLTDVIEQSNFPPDRLELEITESSFLEDMDKVIVLLEKISEFGISISLDDFGSGFSSLNYLRQLPVNFLKIDQSFVNELSDDHDSQVIISSIISLAHSLGKRVIAEGVETEEQLSFLTKHECDFIQGFLYFKPMPLDQVSKTYHNLAKL